MSESQLEIGKHKIPLSGYDLLGYIIPGSLFIIIIYALELVISSHDKQKSIITPVYSTITSLQLTNAKSLFPAIITIFILLVISYIIGHLIASIASFIADHMFIQKGHGYPYENLLGLRHATYSDHTFSQGFYLGNFFWINLYIIVKFISFYTGSPNPYYIPRVIAVYVLLAILIKITYHQKIAWHDKIKSSRVGTSIVQFFTLIYPLPYFVVQNMILSAFKTNTEFNPEFITNYSIKFKRRFGLNYRDAGTNNFWLSYIYVIENSESASPLLTNWLRLYSFSRNMAFTFFLVAIYTLVNLKIQRELFLSNPIKGLHILVLLSISLSYIFIIRYVYLYYSYFSKFTFRSFVSIDESQNIPPQE